MRKNYLLFLFALFIAPVLFGQSNSDSIKTVDFNYIRGYSFGVGSMTMGVSQFNSALNQLGNSAPPPSHIMLVINRISCNPATKIYKSWGLSEQDYSSINNAPGALSYSFTRAMIGGNIGYLVLNNKYFMIPVQAGLTASTVLFNSHVANNSFPQQSFASAVANGTGGGIFNMINFDLLTTITAGFDIKTQLFRFQNFRIYSTNIGLRFSYMRSALSSNAQWDEGLKAVTNLPHTDKNLFYWGIHLTRLLNDHKGKKGKY